MVNLKTDEYEVAQYWEQEEDWQARKLSSRKSSGSSSTLWTDILKALARKPLHAGHTTFTTGP